jgi:hypothetical protein
MFNSYSTTVRGSTFNLVSNFESGVLLLSLVPPHSLGCNNTRVSHQILGGSLQKASAVPKRQSIGTRMAHLLLIDFGGWNGYGEVAENQAHEEEEVESSDWL